MVNQQRYNLRHRTIKDQTSADFDITRPGSTIESIDQSSLSRSIELQAPIASSTLNDNRQHSPGYVPRISEIPYDSSNGEGSARRLTNRPSSSSSSGASGIAGSTRMPPTAPPRSAASIESSESSESTRTTETTGTTRRGSGSRGSRGGRGSGRKVSGIVTYKRAIDTALSPVSESTSSQQAQHANPQNPPAVRSTPHSSEEQIGTQTTSPPAQAPRARPFIPLLTDSSSDTSSDVSNEGTTGTAGTTGTTAATGTAISDKRTAAGSSQRQAAARSTRTTKAVQSADAGPAAKSTVVAGRSGRRPSTAKSTKTAGTAGTTVASQTSHTITPTESARSTGSAETAGSEESAQVLKPTKNQGAYGPGVPIGRGLTPDRHPKARVSNTKWQKVFKSGELPKIDQVIDISEPTQRGITVTVRFEGNDREFSLDHHMVPQFKNGQRAVKQFLQRLRLSQDAEHISRFRSLCAPKSVDFTGHYLTHEFDEDGVVPGT